MRGRPEAPGPDVLDEYIKHVPSGLFPVPPGVGRAGDYFERALSRADGRALPACVILVAVRSFDPRRVGEIECAMWVAYYQRAWGRLLIRAIALVREELGLSWPSALRAAWLLLRANRQWASASHDAEAARRTMRRYYALVAARHDESFDVARAAWLEVEWWRVHRECKERPGGERAIEDALVALYAHVYGAAPDAVRLAAEQRVVAMRHSDRWVREGREPDSPLVDAERAALVRSYAALLAVVRVG